MNGIDHISQFHAKVFGEQLSEISVISSAVEYAFDLHRKNLITIVERFDEIIGKIDLLDQRNHFLFQNVHDKIRSYAEDVPSYWEHNEIVLRELVKPWELPLTYLILPSADHQEWKESCNDVESSKEEESDEVPLPSTTSSPEIDLGTKREVLSYDSLVQVIIHLNRDWSEIGTFVRKKLYFDTILPLLEEYVTPIHNSDPNKKKRVLVPGAGLGRLAVEISALGYDVEANESSGVMLCMMHSLFNNLLPTNTRKTLYPFLHFALQDDWDLEGRRQTISFPHIDDSENLKKFIFPLTDDKYGNNGSSSDSNNVSKKDKEGDKLEKVLTLQYGDFVRVYYGHEERKATYDVIVTNFFIDTGRDIIEYIHTIRHVLKVGGIWINTGPLHYHTAQAIPYSYHHLLDIIELSGFEILHNTKVDASYCGEDRFSMKPEVYVLAVSVFRLKSNSPPSIRISDHSDSVHRPFHRSNYEIKR